MKRKPTTKSLKCERCGHSWDNHRHAENPVPGRVTERCTLMACKCTGYVGLGPASLRRSA